MKDPMNTEIISPQEVRDVDMDEEFNVPCLHKPFPTSYIKQAPTDFSLEALSTETNMILLLFLSKQTL